MGILSDRSAFRHVHGVAVVVFAAMLFAPAAFAQTSTTSGDEYVDLRGVADLVNLLRTVVNPSSSPVLSSPVDRAVSAQAVTPAAEPAGPRVVTVRPTVILPDIEIPDEDSDAPDAVVAETKREAPEPAASKTVPRASAADDDEPDVYPTFRYVFFFGEYVPYFDGWYYYADTWYWGRRGPHPPPPRWNPPPPPPDWPFRLLPGVRLGNGHVTRGGTRTSVSGPGTRTIIGPQTPGGSSLPGAVRIPRKKDR